MRVSGIAVEALVRIQSKEAEAALLLAEKALENHRDKELIIRELDAAPYTERRNILKNRLLSSTAP
jgi:hypothetical protein